MEYIHVSCPHCGFKMELPPEFSRKPFSCKQCWQPIEAGKETELAPNTPPSENLPEHKIKNSSEIHVTCPHCQSEMDVPFEMGGDQFTCPDCKNPIHVPLIKKPAPPPRKTIPCPYCHEEILCTVAACQYCGATFRGEVGDTKNEQDDSSLQCFNCKRPIPNFVTPHNPCPHCGEEDVIIRSNARINSRAQVITLLVLIGIVAIPVGLIASCDAKTEAKMEAYRKAAALAEAQKTPQQKRKEKIDRQFSGWSGAHYKLERLIKKSMNDPSSYEHVRSSYADYGTHITVLTEFRGKNAFGGTILDSVKARVDIDGNILEILEY